MTTKTTSTRRKFIWTAGAALAPASAIAAMTAANVPQNQSALKARLAMLEDLNAIRAVNQAYARHINAGEHQEIEALFTDPSRAKIDESIVAIAADGFEEQDVIEITSDRTTATAVVHCLADTEEVIGPSCPLVEMAREQGGGVLRRTERVVFEHRYVKREGAWKILRSSYRFA
jgi:hypothetical protein